MGWGWPLAAAAAAVVVAVAGLAYVVGSSRPPSAPYEDFGPLSQVPADGAAELTGGQAGTGALVVRAAGVVRAFSAEAAGIAWCPRSRRLETDTAAWAPDGRLVHGAGQSLQPRRVVAHDGHVYVDAVTQLPRPEPAPGGPPPICGGKT